MSHFTLGVVNVGAGECRGGECRTILFSSWRARLLGASPNNQKEEKKLLTLLKFSNLEERETLDCSIQVAQQPDRICAMENIPTFKCAC